MSAIWYSTSREWGSKGPSQFRAVAACCPSMDLAASADSLHDLRIGFEVVLLFNLRSRMIAAGCVLDTSMWAACAALRRLTRFRHQITATTVALAEQ